MTRYTQLPNPPTDPEAEMDAAFDNSDDEEEDNGAGHHFSRAESSNATEPLLRGHTRTISLARPQPGVYDFEYDYPPPPGSPTHATVSTPAFGNSNGLLPTSTVVSRAPSPSLFGRVTRTLLPSRFRPQKPREVGRGNDGVFGNVVAQSNANISRGSVINPNEPELLSEDAQKEPPPSYAVAQQDAVPPYWETTIITSSSTADGELIIDGLPTGNIFSFMWNLLVSMSFQFIGFLLTYIMHTTHSAKYGSRAGLGITLVQYGFYLRSRTVSDDSDGFWSTSPPATPSSNATSIDTGAALNATISHAADAAASQDNIADPQSAAWISFLLMTIGWFILLSSVMGYWRVKRIEQGIRSSAAPPPPPRELTAEEIEYDQQVLRNLEEAFGLGLSLPPRDEEEGSSSASERTTPRTPRRFAWGW